MIEKEQVENTKAERNILEQANCPFLIHLEFAFET